MPERRMYRYEIPVDDQAHPVVLTSNPVRVGSAGRHAVEFWAEYVADTTEARRVFQVFGTGEPLPPDAKWFGTTERTPEGFVWHLYERAATQGGN